MFKTKRSRWILISFCAFLALNALFLIAPATSGVYDNGTILYGWEAALSVGIPLSVMYLVIGVCAFILSRAVLWAERGAQRDLTERHRNERIVP